MTSQKELLERSLKEKWFKESKTNIFSPCPFCIRFKKKCNICTVPKSICNDEDGTSFIERIAQKYCIDGYCPTRVCDLTDEELADIQGLFKDEISKLTR